MAVKKMNKKLSEGDKILLKDVGKQDNIVIYYHIVRLLLKHVVQHFFLKHFRKQMMSMIILHLNFV